MQKLRGIRLQKHQSKVAVVLPGEGSLNIGNEMICRGARLMMHRIHDPNRIDEFTYLRRPKPDEIEAINACSQAIFVGTNIFQSESVGWAWRTPDLNRIKVPYSLFGVGYSGPSSQKSLCMSEETKELVKWARQARAIGARDPQTVMWLQLQGVNSDLIGCPVLGYFEDGHGISTGSSAPILAVRKILLHDSSKETHSTQQRLVDWFFREHENGSCIAQDSADLSLLMNRPVVTGFDEIVSALSKARFVVTTRLHAGMLALALGRPAVFLSHDSRVESFCDMMKIKSHPLTIEGMTQAVDIIRRIDSGDLSQFEHVPDRLRLFVERLQTFLKRQLVGNRQDRIDQPNAIVTMWRRARWQLFSSGDAHEYILHQNKRRPKEMRKD